MPKVTYPTKTRSNLTDFCEAMVAVFGKVERDSDKALWTSKNLNNLKYVDRKHYIINARHFHSLHGSRKGEIVSCFKYESNQIHQLEFAIKAIEKRTPTIHKNLKDWSISFGIGTSKSSQNLLSQSIHQKQRRKIVLDISHNSCITGILPVLYRFFKRCLLCLSIDSTDKSGGLYHQEILGHPATRIGVIR